MSGFIFDELCRYPLCVALHRTHPLARARTVGLAQVAKEPLIGLTAEAYPEYRILLQSLFGKQSRLIQIGEEHDSVTSLITAVETGRGVALVSQLFGHLSGPRVKIRTLQPAPPPLVIGVMYRKDANFGATADFIAAARRAAAPELAKSG